MAALPIYKRPFDILILLFLLGALGVGVTIHAEQLTNPDMNAFKVTKKYPVWPPKQYVDLVQWWGENFDPMILLRPTWYCIAVWYTVTLFVPYYLFALYAFLFGREWIKTPTIIYSASICILMIMLMGETIYNPALASAKLNVVIPVYSIFFVFPFLMLIRSFSSTMFSGNEIPKAKTKYTPFSKRPIDWIIVIFCFAALLIAYTIDAEQLIIPDYFEFKKSPCALKWPPKFVVDAVHWWGETYDPILLARPPWYKALVWIDVIYFGPYYLAAIYAFIVGAEWIKEWSLLYAGIICTNLSVIYFEHVFGPTIQPGMWVLFSAYASYLFIPLIILARSSQQYMFHEIVHEKTK